MTGSAWDWSPYLTGGGTREDAISGLDANFAGALQRMFAEAPPEIQAELRILSAYRSPEIQAQLYEDALQRYGSEAEARQWVAPPGNSRHNHGHAADLSYLGDAARQYAHENADRYGLHFPLSNEDWHIEPIGADGGRIAVDGTFIPPSGQNALAGVAPEQQNALTRMPQYRANNLDAAAFMNAPRPQNQLLSMMPGANQWPA